jgi:NADP-dependent 3-hydroxy acid dehydrogenase YdfG
MKHELRAMQDQGHGSIINLSSTMGRKAAPGASMYTASKHAVEGVDEGGRARTPMPAAPGPVARRELLRSGE